MAARIDEKTQFVDTSGAPIVNGFIYIGTQGTDPTIVANQISIFSNRALTSTLSNPQLTDSFGRSVNKIWIPGQYSIKVENSNGTQMMQDLDAGELTGLDLLGLDNVLGTNTITAEGSPTITSLTDQAFYSFKVTSTNTSTTVTLNIDSVGAKSIVRNVAQSIEIGQFVANDIVVVQYNSTNDDFTWINENLRVFYGNEGADIASAATVDLSAATGNTLSITGKETITAFGTVSAGAVFNLDFPAETAVTITSSSVASPTNILCAAVHGGTTGDFAYIVDHSGSTPSINGMHQITVIDTLNYTIAVNVTVAGTGGTSTLIPSITFNATSMLLPGDEDLLLPPGSDAQAVSLGSGNFRVINVLNGDGSPVKIASKTQAETGASNIVSMTPLRVNEALENRLSSGIGQSELNTTTGDMTATTISLLVTGPGGEFGFWPTVKYSTSANVGNICAPLSFNSADGTGIFHTLGTTLLQRFHIGEGSTGTITARQRFVQASPPYDLGDGAVFSFIFAIIDNASGLIESAYHAPDPPWANNGPTNIRPDRIDGSTGKAYKLIQSIGLNKALLMNPDFIEESEIEITAVFKNSDMDLIPHPFQGNDLTGKTIVLIDPMSKVIERLEEMKNAGGYPSEIIYGNYLTIGNTELGRGRPPNVMSVSVKMK